MDFSLKTSNSCELVLDNGKVEMLINPCTNSIFRVRCRLSGDGGLPPSPLEISAPLGQWVVSESEGSVEAETGSLRVRIAKHDGRIEWFAPDGEMLLSQPLPELARIEVTKYRKAGGETGRTVKTVDGERVFAQSLSPYVDRMAYRAKAFFDWRPGEALHGLGQAEEGIWDLRGNVQYLYPHNMRIPVPFLTSSAGYGILFDCGCLMAINDDIRGSYVFLDTVDILDFYFIHSGSMDGIVSGFRALTGPAAALPKWAFGYIQSKEAYRSQDELLEAASEYRRRGIPLDCVVQDWNTWEEGHWGDKHLDKSRYPDVSGMNAKLHDMDVHSLVSVWPNTAASTSDNEEMGEAGHLLADGSTYDAFSGEARELYWRQMEKELFNGGFDGWWCDSAEPFSGPDWDGEVMREPWERYALVGGEHKRLLDPALACLYGLRQIGRAHV
jgi:alpha-D-xyloside xylohydrolase